VTEPLFIACNLRKTYSQGESVTPVLQDISCTIMPGARIAVQGPSGSGKSTLLHIMAGLDGPSSGSITWPSFGARDSLRPSKVAMAFQTPSLIAPLSVVENIALPLLLCGASDATARTAALKWLARLQLDDTAEKLPQELSGGQGQRVAIARAMSAEPALVLLDEPTGQMDRATAELLFDVLLRLLDAGEAALVLATHDSALAARMRDVWQLKHGHLTR